jgi:hypothetical protein
VELHAKAVDHLIEKLPIEIEVILARQDQETTHGLWTAPL